MRSFFFIILLSILFGAKSQTLEFENFSTKNGLLSDDVYKIFQDKQGYIWLFTNYGAMKYNGNKFEHVLKNLPFEESFIYSYYENSKGRKWVANSNGKIFEIKGDTAVQIPGIEKLSNDLKLNIAEIRQLCVDEYDNIYITTKIGSYKLVKKENYKWYNLDEFNKNDTAFVFLRDIDKSLFGGLSTSYLYWHNKNHKSSFNIKYTNNEGGVKTFKFLFKGQYHFAPLNFIKSNDIIYFSYNNRVFKLDKIGGIKEIIANGFVLNLSVDRKKQLWVATLNNGLFQYDEKGDLVARYFEGKTVNHVFLDSQNGIWATTEGLGIFHCKNINELHFDKSEVLGSSIIFIKKIDNHLFIGTSSGEIDIIQPDKKEILKISNERRLDVLDIIKYKNGYLTNNRNTNMYLLKIIGKTESRALPLIKPPFFPSQIYKLGGDSILCLGRRNILILNQGLCDFENEKGNNILWLDKKLFCFAQRGGEKLLGTEDGVYSFNGLEISRPKYLRATNNAKIVMIIKDSDDNFWFCSKGRGLFKLTTSKQLINYSIDQNLPSNVVNHISFTSNNEVLLSTNQGLFYNKTADFNKWVQLMEGDVNSAEILNDKIYCGTKKGVVVINKANGFKDKKIYYNLSSVSVNKENYKFSDLNNLAYYKNNIEFYFDAISFSKDFYDIKYQLVGPQNYSGVSSNHQISFQKLIPGKYILTATLLDQNRSGDKIQVEFNIIPAIWQTTWFKILSLVFFIFIISLIVWFFFKRYKNKLDKKNEIERLIIEYKLIALKAQINPHFMSNCLTAIQHLIMSNKVEQANIYIVKFSRLVRQVLNFSSKSLVALNEEMELTQLNVSLEQLRFDNKFVFDIVKNETLDWNKTYLPPLIIQPIIENAIWHGLLPLKKQRDGRLSIKAEAKDDSLIISIEDNGVGRFRKTESVGGLRESKGIALTKQRIQNLNNLYGFTNADLIYEDLIDENFEPSGTRVIIILPLNLQPDKDE